jgi:hypothetical protein
VKKNPVKLANMGFFLYLCGRFNFIGKQYNP